MDLSQQVRQYYLDNIHLLPHDKKYHFASRLYAWNDDEECKKILSGSLSTLIPDSGDFTKMYKDMINNPPSGKINAIEERAPYFEKYPLLRGAMLALFRVRHLLFLHNIDTREEFLKAMTLDELKELGNKLRGDTGALNVLSTYAINFLYLSEKILFPQHFPPLKAQFFIDVADSITPESSEDILLYIYFYTHCIIGESNFYASSIRNEELPIYREMLRKSESIIAKSYDYINLDNKLEFLVCSRICDYTTNLESKIYEECINSVSGEGTFLIDKANKAAQTNKTSFQDSEHRNVLFIMGKTPYKHAQKV